MTGAAGTASRLRHGRHRWHPPPLPTRAGAKPTVAMPLKGTTIKVLYSDLNYWPFIQKYLPEFETTDRNQGDRLIWSLSLTALTQIETELSSGSTAYDSVMNIFIKAQRWIRAGWLVPMDDFHLRKDKFDIDDFCPALVECP